MIILNQAMKSTIVCGLLGSGKTTFIKNILAGAPGRTVVLVNDFGAAGVDGEIFSADGIQAVELPSGCVCCTLKTDLIKTIRDIIRNFSPDHLFIEPSGVASPSGVIEALASVTDSQFTVIGIVDATEFLEMYEAEVFGPFFNDQIMASDVLLVNKTDLTDKETSEKTAALLGSLNPGAVIFLTVNAALPGQVPETCRTRQASESNDFHLRLETISFSVLERGLTGLKDFLGGLAAGKYGHVIRAKALVQTIEGAYRFDLSSGNIDAVPFEKDVENSRLVVIGEGLKKDLLEKCGYIKAL